MAEWLSGCGSHSGRVAEWLSGCSSHSGRVAEWLSGCGSHSGRVAEWLLRFREPCCTSTLFFRLAPGLALEKFAAIVNSESKPTKVNWALSWPSALETCGKTVL